MDNSAAVLGMNRDLVNNFNDFEAGGDLENLISSYYAEDAYLIAPDRSVCLGGAQIREFFSRILNTDRPRMDVGPRDGALDNNQSQVLASGDLIYVIGRYVFALSDGVGPLLGALEGSGNRLVIFKHQEDGSLRAVVDILGI